MRLMGRRNHILTDRLLVTYVMRKVTLPDFAKNLITQNREANQVKVNFRDAVTVVIQHSILVTIAQK